MAIRQGVAAGIVMVLLSGGLAFGGSTAQGVQVPTLSEFHEQSERIGALEARVAQLENATPSTTLPPTTIPQSTTLPPQSTTTTTIVDASLLPADGVVLCDNCVVYGIEGFTYTNVNLNGRVNVTLRGVTVDGSADSGPLQSGTVNIRDARNILVEDVAVANSPRSCFSLEGSTNVTLRAVACVGAVHLGIHGGFVNDITIDNAFLSDFSQRNVEVGWESGGIKLLRGSNIVIKNSYIHDGNGPGIWLDGGIRGAQVQGNDIRNLSAEGIFVEISTEVYVEGNTVVAAPRAVTSSRMAWCYGAGILVATSSSVDVINNTVTASVHGILVIDQSWRADTPSGYQPEQYSVLNNTVSDVNKVGACEDVDSDRVYGGQWTANSWSQVGSFLPPLA